ncbi:MAG: TetR/AcrR family transcriptional regulator [Aliishimia sp.]
MSRRLAPVLHRDDPDKDPLVGHVKVTRADWLNVARGILVTNGVSEVKIQPIASKLAVSRSSFYWYFKSRSDLLDALLDDWEARNTQAIQTHCGDAAKTITQAVCNFFRCFVDPHSFDQGLDFAIREWARRDASVKSRIEQADKLRVQAVTDMFERFDYAPQDADARARILYFMQQGYNALDQVEPLEDRMDRLEAYLLGFTGRTPLADECADFRAWSREKLK